MDYDVIHRVSFKVHKYTLRVTHPVLDNPRVEEGRGGAGGFESMHTLTVYTLSHDSRVSSEPMRGEKRGRK